MTYIDPVKSSPDNYKLLFEDDTHRLLEMTLKAGETDVEHSHTSELVYFMVGSSVTIRLPNGESMDADIPDGHVMAHEAWTHTVSNTGNKDLRAIIFETK